MSEHSLPPDRASWPTDPYALLGVRPGVSPRDLRKAYLHLIRTYKPEHAPDEFRLIRGAYERLKDLAEPTAPAELDDWSTPVASPSSEPDDEIWIEPSSDAWDQAIQGKLGEAYRELTLVAGGVSAPEEVYLQLYWLLDSSPELDPERLPVDWLVRGLLHHGPRAARLTALLTRQAALDPELVVGERVQPLLSSRVPPTLLPSVAASRWRAARVLGRWKVISTDLASLRGWLPRLRADIWSQLVIAAAMNLAWAQDAWQGRFKLLKAEAEELARNDFESGDDPALIEYSARAAWGLDRLRDEHSFAPELHDLLRLTWDHPTPSARRHLMAHLADVAANPVDWFGHLDVLMNKASAALDMLMKLPDHLDIGNPSPRLPRDPAEVKAAVVEFLGSQQWWKYPSLRPHLLSFCLAEMISPAILAHVIRDESLYETPDARHLADLVTADWPLACVYRACEIIWE